MDIPEPSKRSIIQKWKHDSMYKPADLFLSIVDIFAILVPGGIFTYVTHHVFPNEIQSTLLLEGWESWIAFFLFSFFFGHIFSFIAEKIDKSWSSNIWISSNEELWDTVFTIRNRIGKMSDSSEISIYQWCRSVLITTSPEATADINRIIASTDFFRNLYVVLPLVAIISFVGQNWILGIICIILSFPCIYFSEQGRHKLHKRICNHIIVLDALGKLSSNGS